MPVTLHPAPHNDFASFSNQIGSATSEQLLKSAVSQQLGSQVKELFQSSFDNNLGSASRVFPSSNSFVRTSVNAYNGHHHLVIRPDDVWLAILTQFTFFVCAHAEELRHFFVAHQGKKTLSVSTVGTQYSVDFGALAQQMGKEIEKNVVDPDLRKWIIPDFTTTETNDEIVASVVMMATMKEYFDYQMFLTCGLPAVTLLGEKDWEKLVTRIDKLKTFGKETTDWHNALKPVLSRFVTSFDKPNDPDIIDVWQRIAHHHGGGSGPTYLTGWITAFCFFSGKGENLHYGNGGRLPDEDDVQSSIQGSDPGAVLRLDGVLYHKVDTGNIPLGYTEVDVLLNDNGVKFQTIMVAGSVGTRVSDSGIKIFSKKNSEEVHDGKNDVVQPVSGWWIFHKQELKKDENGKNDVVQPVSGWSILHKQELNKDENEKDLVVSLSALCTFRAQLVYFIGCMIAISFALTKLKKRLPNLLGYLD